MPRPIPTALQLSLNTSSTTLTRVLKFKLRSGVTYGICMTNKDVIYDHGDGDGPIVYVASNGFDPSTISADEGYSVDNAEGYALISNDITGVTVEMVNAGALENAQWQLFYLDYENLSIGSGVLLDAGDVGITSTEFGMIWTPELLSFVMRLKQAVGSVWTRTCRAEFGTAANSQTGCGVDITTMWKDFEVVAVGAENDRTFTISVAGSDAYFPGRVLWETGDNAGSLFATEEYDGVSKVVTLNNGTGYAIKVGDTGKIRPDCDKTKTMCKGTYNNYVNMKAEDTIPVSDAVAISTPGAQL